MKYCTHCGKELFEEAVICVGCGCPVRQVEQPVQAKSDYKMILRNTKIFFAIGCVLLAFGIFAWIATDLLALLYTVIGEHIHSITSYGHPPTSSYHTWDMLALYSSTVSFFAAEMVFLIPKNQFNTAFKGENQQLLYKNKELEYKKAAKEKNKAMNEAISCYKICWIMAILTLVLFIISVFMPSCTGV